jgi:Na+/proline symporter
MDSVLLVAASTGYRNLVQPAFLRARTDSPKQLQWTRLMVVALAILAAGLALEPPGDILQITIFSGSLYAVCFLPAVVLGLYWSRGSSTAVLASMAAGIATLLIWLMLGYNTLLHEVFPALAASIVVYVGCALRHSQRVDLDQLLTGD